MKTKLIVAGAGVLVACVGAGCVGVPGEAPEVEEVGASSSRCIVVGPGPHGQEEEGTRTLDQGWPSIPSARVVDVR